MGREEGGGVEDRSRYTCMSCACAAAVQKRDKVSACLAGVSRTAPSQWFRDSLRRPSRDGLCARWQAAAGVPAFPRREASLNSQRRAGAPVGSALKYKFG